MDSLKFVISDIIKYNTALQTFDNHDLDSLHEFQLGFIKRNTYQSELEIIIDTTNSISLKYYASLALLYYPSDKISDVFTEILLDFENNEYCTPKEDEYDDVINCYSIEGSPWYSACNLLEDSTLRLEIRINLEKEIFQMDSISIAHLRYNSNGDEMDFEFLDKVAARNMSIRNTKVTNEFYKSYFNYRVNKHYGRIYGKLCGAAASQPLMRIELESVFERMDSISFQLNYQSEIFYFDLWLNSNYLEIQTYGAEALIRLNNMGALLSKKQIKKIKQIKRSLKRIYTCEGCFARKKTIIRALSSFNLK